MKKAIVYYINSKEEIVNVSDINTNRMNAVVENIECIVDYDLGHIVYENINNKLVKIDDFVNL